MPGGARGKMGLMEMISRAEVINGLLRLFPPDSRYLEIGDNRGETFFAIGTRNKVAVNPTFCSRLTMPERKIPGARSTRAPAMLISQT